MKLKNNVVKNFRTTLVYQLINCFSVKTKYSISVMNNLT